MNPIVAHAISGKSFFTGIILVLLYLGLSYYFQNRVAQIIFRMAGALGVVFIAISSTPFALWVYVLWIGLFVGCVVVRYLEKYRKYNIFCLSVFGLFSIILIIIEYGYHTAPAIKYSENQIIYVLGDSLSAGIDDRVKIWPDIMNEKSSFKVVSLAQAGARVQEARYQAEEIMGERQLVLVEIGGNDVLGNTSAREFESQLDKLLSKLQKDGHGIAMFELPLPPFYHRFGSIQRRLAKKYDVTMIPKRILTRIISRDDFTLDGLHLSQEGQSQMSSIISNMIEVDDAAVDS